MKTSDFYYNLPHSLIAQEPILKRDHSKLLILDRQTGMIQHRKFFEIEDYINGNDVLVLNNTKVIPARMFVQKMTGGKVELLLLKKREDLIYEVLLGGAGRIKVEDNLVLPDGKMTCRLIKKLGEGKWLVQFGFPTPHEFNKYLKEYGITPTPPYIKRQNPREDDKKRYQTVYAKKSGSSAAPTAGLHFTEKLLEKLKVKGVEIVYLTLHVGLGTFKPVKSEKIKNHTMESEFLDISPRTAEKLESAKRKGKRIIAIGTTSTRALETASQDGKISSYQDETDLFIYPGYKFNFVDAMVTNFHLPDSTLILLVSAFAGKDTILKSYNEAIANRYRFYSYGDAMFII